MKGSLNEPIGKRSHEETEGFNEEENSRVQSRPRAGESVPQSMLSDSAWSDDIVFSLHGLIRHY